MEGAAAIAVGVGAILVALYLTRKQEESTAQMVARIQNQKANEGLGLSDLVSVGTVAGATALGGPKAGLFAASATGLRL